MQNMISVFTVSFIFSCLICSMLWEKGKRQYMIKPRQVHNTNSPTFIKLDHTDLTYIIKWVEEFEDLTPDEIVTRDRVAKMIELMEEKRAMHIKGEQNAFM